jgi:hypothetical protein
MVNPSWLANVQSCTAEESIMPQSPHNRIAELHNLAIHAHQAAAVAHGHGDHLTAHELSKRALEHSMNAYGHAEKLVELEKVDKPHADQPASKR